MYEPTAGPGIGRKMQSTVANGGGGNFFSKVSDVAGWTGAVATTVEQEVKLSGMKSFGSNLKGYSKPFYGNQYVKTVQSSKVLNVAKGVGSYTGYIGIAADALNFGFGGMSSNRFNVKFALGLVSIVAPEIGVPLMLIDYYYGDYIGDQINNVMLPSNK